MLKGKVAIVTGAGSGIGAATAALFAKEGAKVICADIDFNAVSEVAKDINSTSRQAIPLKVDVSSKTDNINLVETALKEFGQLDIFFANAGILNPFVPIPEETESSFLRTLEINTIGCFYAIKYGSEAMKKSISEGKSQTGSIICTASIAAIRADLTPLQYTASKGAILSMVQSANDRLLLDKIRVNAVLPGGVATKIYFEMAQRLDQSGLILQGYDYKRFPPIDAEDIANVVVFLASDLSKVIKGQTIVADAGMSQSMGSQPYPKLKSQMKKAAKL